MTRHDLWQFLFKCTQLKVLMGMREGMIFYSLACLLSDENIVEDFLILISVYSFEKVH